MSGPELTVGKGVIAELVKTAAFEVPGVARLGFGGPLAEVGLEDRGERESTSRASSALPVSLRRHRR